LQELAARVGLRRNTLLAVHAALNGANGIAVNGSTSSYTNGASSSKPKAKVSDYLVGSTLDEALANKEDVDVFWPFESGNVSDWVQAEALWYAGTAFER
jgi:actin-related protein 9